MYWDLKAARYQSCLLLAVCSIVWSSHIGREDLASCSLCGASVYLHHSGVVIWLRRINKDSYFFTLLQWIILDFPFHRWRVHFFVSFRWRMFSQVLLRVAHCLNGDYVLHVEAMMIIYLHTPFVDKFLSPFYLSSYCFRESGLLTSHYLNG